MKTVVRPRARQGLAALSAAAALTLVAATPLLAQGWQWPWDAGPKPPPVPAEPLARPQPQVGPPPAAQPQPGQPPPTGWAQRSTPICLQLEQRLVQESQPGNQSQNLVPMVEAEIRQVEQQRRRAQSQLDRSDCWDTFLFSKTLRRTKKCVDLSTEVEGARRRLADLETQRQQLMGTTGRSYQDEIIAELARNNCGANYTQQARRNSNPFSSLWSSEDEGGGGTGGLGSFNALPYATYRTVCVRLCDGYYFPVSFSTLPNHFERDAETCQSKCAAPAELYYYQNPGGSADQMVAYQSSVPYAQLKTAFRYRKEYVSGCSCKQAEYLPEGGAPQQSGSLGNEAPGSFGAPSVSAAANPQAAAPTSSWPADGGSEQLPWAPR